MKILPYSFAGFLQVLGEEDARKAYSEVPFPNSYFDRVLRLFHLYTLIGGMPEVVGTFASGRDLTELPPVYEKILDGFMDRIAEASPTRKTGEFARNIYRDIFPYAAMRISFNNFSNLGRGSRDTANAFRLLEACGLLRLVYPATAAVLPILPEKKRAPRLQVIDTGIVNYASDIQKNLFDTDDLLSIFDGQIARHVSGQEILASGDGREDDLSFWVRGKLQSSAEVDFLIPYENQLIPVILKNGEPGRLRSLHQFMDIAPHPFAVRLWAQPLSIRQAETLAGKKYFLMSLPYFLAGRIREHLGGFVRLVGRNQI